MPKQYEVEAVLGRRIVKGAVQYLLKWKGYAEDEATWTLSSKCGSCEELVAKFEKNHPPAQASPTPISVAPASGARGSSSTRLQSKIANQKSDNSTPTTGRSARSQRRSSAVAKSDGPKSSSNDSEEDRDEKSDPGKQTMRTSGRMSAGGTTVKQSSNRRRNSPGKGTDDSDEDSAKTGETTAEAKKRKVDARRSSDVVKNANSSSDDSEEEEDKKPGMSRPTRRTSARMSMGGKASVKQSVKRGRKSEDGAKTAETIAAAKKRKVDAKESDVAKSENAKSSSDDSEEEEVEKPETGKSTTRTSTRVSVGENMTKRQPAKDGRLSSSTRANVAEKKASVLVYDDVDEDSAAVTRRSTRRSQAAGNGDAVVSSVKRPSIDPDAKLEEALTLLLVHPYARFITPSTDPSGDDAVSIPAKVVKPEEIPGITVWVEKSYTDKGHTITAPKGNFEKFGDREVLGIIGYVPAEALPFVLVKLSKKKEEASMRVKDCVQAVHCPLAERLFPKAYKSYMDRVAQLPSSSTAAGSMDVAGPSGHATPR